MLGIRNDLARSVDLEILAQGFLITLPNGSRLHTLYLPPKMKLIDLEFYEGSDMVFGDLNTRSYLGRIKRLGLMQFPYHSYETKKTQSDLYISHQVGGVGFSSKSKFNPIIFRPLGSDHLAVLATFDIPLWRSPAQEFSQSKIRNEMINACTSGQFNIRNCLSTKKYKPDIKASVDPNLRESLVMHGTIPAIRRLQGGTKKILDLNGVSEKELGRWRTLYNPDENKTSIPIMRPFTVNCPIKNSQSNAKDTLGIQYKMLAKLLNKLHDNNMAASWRNLVYAMRRIQNDVSRVIALRKIPNTQLLDECRAISIIPAQLKMDENLVDTTSLVNLISNNHPGIIGFMPGGSVHLLFQRAQEHLIRETGFVTHSFG
tara:strand:- start:100 stop:1215 length:1116 start_codon:yes stop_codon:yes gene_type:complete